MSKSIQYIHIVASRVSNLTGRKISGSEWGNLGKVIGNYGSDIINEVLDAFENDEVGIRLTSVNLLHKIAKIAYDSDFIDEDWINKVRNDLLDNQEKGQRLLKGLINGQR